MRRANKQGYVTDPERRRELSILIKVGLRKVGQGFLVGEFLNQSWSSVDSCVSQEWASLGFPATLSLREPNEKDSLSTNTAMDFRYQWLGPFVSFVHYGWRSARHILWLPYFESCYWSDLLSNMLITLFKKSD